MLKSAVIYFKWSPPRGGFRWESAQPVTDDWTIAESKVTVLVPNGFPMLFTHYWHSDDEYEPLVKASALFREFAALHPVPESIMAFADKYGPLTRGQLFVPLGSISDQFPQPPTMCKLAYGHLRPGSPEGQEANTCQAMWVMKGALSGDSFTTWNDNIRAVRFLVELWDAIQHKQITQIERYVQLKSHGKKKVVTLRGEMSSPISTITFSPKFKVDIVKAAEHALIAALGERTQFTNSISLYPPESRHSRKLAIIPHSLIDAIWLQFAVAVLEDKRFRECEICGKPFEVSPQVARTNRTLCGAACKAKAHRQRREQALKLAARGLKAPEISKKVGSQLKTVKRWLLERKE